jgi:cytochrome c-type biogenesis protein
MNVSGAIALSAGLLSFFSPCILPLIPSYLIFISGVSLDSMEAEALKKHRKLVIIHSLAFIMGFSFLFVSLGLTSSWIAGFFSANQEYIVRIGGLLLIVMGLSLLDLIKIPILNREKMVHLKEKPVGLLGSFVVGVTFCLGWAPCVGPALSSILIIAGTKGEMGQGVYLLAAYSLGLAIPFFISALLFDKVFFLVTRFRNVTRYTMKILGALLILMGILLFWDLYGLVTSRLGTFFTG